MADAVWDCRRSELWFSGLPRKHFYPLTQFSPLFPLCNGNVEAALWLNICPGHARTCISVCTSLPKRWMKPECPSCYLPLSCAFFPEGYLPLTIPAIARLCRLCLFPSLGTWCPWIMVCSGHKQYLKLPCQEVSWVRWILSLLGTGTLRWRWQMLKWKVQELQGSESPQQVFSLNQKNINNNNNKTTLDVSLGLQFLNHFLLNWSK